MFAVDQYQLLDFGDGRKLERFGPVILDRPAPAAEKTSRAHARLWRNADARYRRTTGESGTWSPKDALPKTWTLTHQDTTLLLRPTDFGHLGVFPEQAENWDWMAGQLRRVKRPCRVLNLFGYTGGATLAAAACGAEVVHVDAAKNVVGWARRNADHSGLGDAPIRWIVEDAAKFARRELRRGSQYDAVVLDPPSYGHGPKGETWKISGDLMPLLTMCGELTRRRRAFVLLTCHSTGWGPAELEAMLADAVFGSCQSGVLARSLVLRAEDGRVLPCGFVARWPG